jgi:hypothetical protein
LTHQQLTLQQQQHTATIDAFNQMSFPKQPQQQQPPQAMNFLAQPFPTICKAPLLSANVPNLQQIDRQMLTNPNKTNTFLPPQQPIVSFNVQR